jgi:hypothetical protein
MLFELFHRSNYSLFFVRPFDIARTLTDSKLFLSVHVVVFGDNLMTCKKKLPAICFNMLVHLCSSHLI